MWKVKFLVIFASSITILHALSKDANGDRKLVCYFGSWATYRPGVGKYDVENIDPMVCTHLIFGFAGLNEDGSIKILDEYNELEGNYRKGAFRRFTNLKLRNPKLKTLLAVGGWNEGSPKYSRMVASAEKRRHFINSTIPLITQYNFDGIDFDWEYPTHRGGKPEDRLNYVQFLKELKEEYVKHGWLVTAAVAAGKYTVEPAYDIPAVSQHLDFMNVMAYDLRGFFPDHHYTGHHAAFDAMEIDVGNDSYLNIKYAMDLWVEGGADPQKLIVGMPTYGRGFTLADPKNNSFYAPANQPIPAGPFTREAGFWGYHEICSKLSEGGWTVVHNEKVVGPYAYKGSHWIGYDDVESIRFKSEWIVESGFGGGMLWSLDTDDYIQACDGEVNPLIKTAHRIIVGEIVPEPTTTVDPNQPTTPPTTTPDYPDDGECHFSGQRIGENCASHYFVCVDNGQGGFNHIQYSCTPPLYYDSELMLCNWGHEIGCT